MRSQTSEVFLCAAINSISGAGEGTLADLRSLTGRRDCLTEAATFGRGKQSWFSENPNWRLESTTVSRWRVTLKGKVRLTGRIFFSPFICFLVSLEFLLLEGADRKPSGRGKMKTKQFSWSITNFLEYRRLDFELTEKCLITEIIHSSGYLVPYTHFCTYSYNFTIRCNDSLYKQKSALFICPKRRYAKSKHQSCSFLSNNHNIHLWWYLIYYNCSPTWIFCFLKTQL